MPKNPTHDPVTGSIKHPVGRVILAAPMFYGFLGGWSIFMPVYASSAVLPVSLLATVGAITMLWMNWKPNLVTKFFNLIFDSRFIGSYSDSCFWLLLAQSSTSNRHIHINYDYHSSADTDIQLRPDLVFAR